MTLEQLHDLKRWHMTHGRLRPIEGTLCDAVLAAWIGGWFLLPSLIALEAWLWLPCSLGMVLAPEGYHLLRGYLHRRGLLRCEWLDAVRPTRDL